MQLLNEPIFYNPKFKRDNKPIYIKEWEDNNILTVKDLMESEQTFLDFQSFQLKFTNITATNFILYNGVIQSIRKCITKIKNNDKIKTTSSTWTWNIIKGSNRKVKDALHTDTKLPTATAKWNAQFQNLNWEKIFALTFRTTGDRQLQWFQMRILHRILPTEKYLFMCKIKDSPLCSFCKNENETLVHLFWECEICRQFWNDLLALIHSQCTHCERLSFTKQLVIFGTVDNVMTDRAMDFIILYAKFFIFKCKFNVNNPNLTVFLQDLRYRLITEKGIARRRERENLFTTTWNAYKFLLENTAEN